MKTPTTDYDALVLALKLAISAPTQDKAQLCVDHADELAARLTPLEVQRAKREAAQHPTKF